VVILLGNFKFHPYHCALKVDCCSRCELFRWLKDGMDFGKFLETTFAMYYDWEK